MSSAALDALPAELLHRVFVLLEKKEVIALRSACSVFAAVGSEYLFERVYTVLKRDRLERLCQIAKHPLISRQVKSIYYQADSWQQLHDYNEWNVRRQSSYYNPQHGYTLSDEYPDHNIIGDEDNERNRRAWGRAQRKFRATLANLYSQAKLDQAYDAYRAEVLDSHRMRAAEFDVKCFADIFKGCPNLDDVIITFTHSGPHGTSLNFKYLAFKETLTCPISDTIGSIQGPQPLNAVCEAAISSGKRLRGLTMAGATCHILQQHAETFEDMQTAMSSLHKLCILFEPYGETSEEEEDSIEESRECFEEGKIYDLLSTIRDLRVLKLHFPIGLMGEGSANLNDIFANDTWSRLREIKLTCVIINEGELAVLLMRHKRSLRIFSLTDASLSGWDEWDAVFRSIGGQLPRLKKVKLRGQFSSDFGPQYDFGMPGDYEEYGMSPFRDAVENFLLNGGDYPDVVAFDDLLYEDRGSLEQIPGNGPLLEPDYTSDGSVINYESDSFDEAS